MFAHLVTMKHGTIYSTNDSDNVWQQKFNPFYINVTNHDTKTVN